MNPEMPECPICKRSERVAPSSEWSQDQTGGLKWYCNFSHQEGAYVPGPSISGHFFNTISSTEVDSEALAKECFKKASGYENDEIVDIIAATIDKACARKDARIAELEDTQDALHWIEKEPAFRGLWRSRLVKDDGFSESGWCVTYVADGDYCEMEYQKSAMDAIRLAQKRLAPLGD